MGTYVNVVSTIKPVDKIRTFIGGVATDITSAWTFVNGVRKQIFPTTEEWTLVYEKTTAGAYGTDLTWGKYKIVYSGGGGGGAASSATSSRHCNASSGSAGEENTYYLDVSPNTTTSVGGTVGAGGTGAYAKPSTATVGVGGSGYQSGANGTKSGEQGSGFRQVMTAGGGGGGSTSVGGVTIGWRFVKGGNGGTGSIQISKIDPYYYGYGGAGGSDGTSSGTGASGGAGSASNRGGTVTGGSGADGYVKIYKSNFYPA